MRQYPSDMPKQTSKAFIGWLAKNNQVVDENFRWILIKNSYIANQLVCYYKGSAKYLVDLEASNFFYLQEILKPYKKNHIYINSDENKSIPDRLHIHVVLDNEESIENI